MLHPPKQHAVMKVLTESKVFYFCNNALCAATTCNKMTKISPDNIRIKPECLGHFQHVRNSYQ